MKAIDTAVTETVTEMAAATAIEIGRDVIEVMIEAEETAEILSVTEKAKP